MKTILCIDDFESHRFLIEEELSEEGYKSEYWSTKPSLVKPKAERCYLEPGCKEDLKVISQAKPEGGSQKVISVQ